MKKILGIVILSLLLSGNAYAVNTVKDLEKCINSKSKLLDKENIKNTCIFKLQKKIPSKLVKLKDTTAIGGDYSFVETQVTNISTDYLITEILLLFYHVVKYDEEKGLLILVDNKSKINEFSYYWIEPGNSERSVISLSWDGELGYNYSTKSEISKNFKLTVDNLKKYKNWNLEIKEIYGFKIN
tara:strand:- start:117 stop:668 length:552 start_codon:yes stop_codon:yes gene_type:complete